EEVDAAMDVVAEILRGVRHAFADEGVCGEVHHGVGLHILQRDLDVVALLEVADDEFRPRVHGGRMAFGEVVKDRDGVAGVDQLFDADAADVAGTAGDEDFHGTHSLAGGGGGGK